MVNDYFTPNIKAEVILDMLLTPYIKQMLKAQLNIDAKLLTKEMSIKDIDGTDDRGAKIDYVLEDNDMVYLVGLKTTRGSINSRRGCVLYWHQNTDGRAGKGQNKMSIYKKEATPEEMKQEAVLRMELLRLDAQTIQSLLAEGMVSLSQPAGRQVLIQPVNDELSQQIRHFEEEYECLVYHALWSKSPMAGECRSFQFISPASFDWKGEQRYIESSGLVYAYSHSELEEGVSEIVVEPKNGSLARIG